MWKEYYRVKKSISHTETNQKSHCKTHTIVKEGQEQYFYRNYKGLNYYFFYKTLCHNKE